MEDQNTDQGREDRDQGNEQQDQGQQKAPPPHASYGQSVIDTINNNGKVVAIVSYFGLLGWIVAIIVHGNGKTSLGTYHLRQTLGIMLTFMVLCLVIWIPIIGWLIGLGMFVLWLVGLITAINGEEKPLPIFGDFYQKTFAGIN